MTEHKFEKGHKDPYSETRWVYVSREMAHGHPKGKLGVVLYAVVAVLILTGLYKIYLVLSGGEPLWVAAIVGGIPVLAGLGLLIRMPWSIVLVVFMAGISLFGFINSVDGTGVWVLVENVAALGLLFYLVEGERPNLIYRHRYRSYEKD